MLMFKSTHEKIVKRLEADIQAKNNCIINLQADLKQAQKNDMPRDPDTGKFITK